MKDLDFQRLQVDDFIERLHSTLNLTPTSFQYRLREYLISNLGRATVLDQSVNSPNSVRGDFGDSLDRFFKNHPTVSKNPSDWGDKHLGYEQIILDDYGLTRFGTDMTQRYNNIKGRL